MSDDKSSDRPFDGDDIADHKLWAALGDIPRETPSENLRRNFYTELERFDQTSFAERLRRWLGLSNNTGWITAAACLLVGVGVGQVVDRNSTDDPNRLAVLEQNVALLNRELILDRLEDATAGKRLRGVVDAGYLVEDDMEIARALLMRATEDSVYSVRTAAIDALGPSLTTASVGNELMKLLESAESPLVQLALVDLVLRNGSDSQLEQLLRLAETGALHPDLITHVEKSFGRESV
jgi:hypothetical protein